LGETVKYDKPICFFDLEATGLDISKDRIVEFAACYYGSTRTKQHLRINPGIPIPQEVTAIHGISDDTIKSAPKFSEVAQMIHESISGCIIAGFNCRNFDIPLLWEELYRCGIEWKIDRNDIIDVGNIFKLKHPRDLTAAVKVYCNRDHADAHTAMADVNATADVFISQLSEHGDLFDMTCQQLSEYCQMEERRVDLCGTIVLNKEGIPVFNTKRNKGVPVVNDIGYAEWFLRNDFPASTKRAIEAIIRQ
jgi:DNA polymerase III subunit epsilon